MIDLEGIVKLIISKAIQMIKIINGSIVTIKIVETIKEKIKEIIKELMDFWEKEIKIESFHTIKKILIFGIKISFSLNRLKIKEIKMSFKIHKLEYLLFQK